ncbi:TonB-dependent receptor domain-containing protein [Flavobacterium sp. FlaQc-47]|uniref:TonB-dependent receptor n=1 Tax=Flavobacterium sp. FlaQc-47 TaxID=3374180 RepID=UPI003756DE8F
MKKNPNCTGSAQLLFKYNLKMKLSILLIWVGFFTLQANTIYGQRDNITITLQNVTLEDILDKIESSTKFKFFYQVEDVDLKRIVSLNASNEKIEVVLGQLFKKTRTNFKIDKQDIYLIKKTETVTNVIKQTQAQQQDGRVSGKIIDDHGESLPNASVRIIETGQSLQTDIDGSYTISLKRGIYTIEVSYISFVTQRITDVEVIDGKNTFLNISLKLDTKGLKEVVVTSGYKKASAAGLLAKQKNASEISNGISAEQIARTPDKNIGESLKRISGISTVDNKFVVVRGIGERYNSAMLDGVILPSTEVQQRNFSFDLIPSNLVDNVVVSKTVTPDMNASFGGGLIQINTKDIPNENFTSFSVGASYNDQTTGKDFLSHKRGKYDYLGFDDGRRDFPTGLVHTDRTAIPNNGLSDTEYQSLLDGQSKKFKNDNFSVYKYTAAPSQNYQFSLGRLFVLDTVSQNKLGFTGSVSYRNTQQTNLFDQQRRSDWEYTSNNQGASYSFNTTIGALLNIGLQLGKNRFSLRNTYTHLYDNTLIRTVGYNNSDGPNDIKEGLPPNRIQEVDDPTFTNLLQNKLSGQHQLGKIKLEWNLARTGIDRKEKDISIGTQRPVLVGNDYQYFYITSQQSEARITPTSRQNYQNAENHYSWNVDATLPFSIGNVHNSLKTGYFGITKKATFDWQIAALVNSPTIDPALRYIPISEMINPENFGVNGYNYFVNTFYLDSYEGKSKSHAAYLMLDTRIMDKLRLVYGIRAEYFKYTEVKNGYNDKVSSKFTLPDDKDWQWLPSANLTYSPTEQINIRAAFSSSVVRPELMDNSQFFRYNPYLGANFGNNGLTSTRIDSYDFKTEWFPGAGEIISAGAFYKKFDKPAELSFILTNGNISYNLRNSDNAKVYGLEFELRKNLGMFLDNEIFNNLMAYGNLTLQKSTVTATYPIQDPNDINSNVLVPVRQDRSMYGQAPYLINAGIQYNGDKLGINVMYNKSGQKTYIVSSYIDQIEYEMPRAQVDIQLGYKFLNKTLEVKVNGGNLFNTASTFFINNASYQPNPNQVIDTDPSDAVILKPGFSNKYEEGDQLRFRQKFGRTYSTSITYNF